MVPALGYPWQWRAEFRMALPVSGSTSIPVQCWGGAAEAGDSGRAFLYVTF